MSLHTYYAVKMSPINKNKIKIFKSIYNDLESCINDNIYLVSKGVTFSKITLDIDVRNYFVVNTFSDDKIRKLYKGIDFGERPIYKVYIGFIYAENIKDIEIIDVEKELDKNSFLYTVYKKQKLLYKKGGDLNDRK